MAFDIPEPDEAAIRSALAHSLPGLETAAIEALGHGWAFWAFRAGDTALRFPRDPEFAQMLAVEAEVMRELAPTLPLAVSIITVHEDGPNGLPFTSHRLVPGVPVSSLGRPLALDAGRVLGRFIRAMHSFPVARAVELGLTYESPADRRGKRRRMLDENIAPRVFPLIAPEAQERVRTKFAAYLQDDANFAYRPVVSHSDIDDWNVLASPETGEITGVIDWGDISIGDPAGDFCSVLYGALGDAGLRDQLPALLEAHGMTPAELDEMRPRCRFYEFCWPLYDILYGLDSHNYSVVQRGLESLYSTIRDEARR